MAVPPEDFRRMALERFKCCENIEWLAKELGVRRQTLYRWHEESERNAEEGEPIPEKSRESRLRSYSCCPFAHPQKTPVRMPA